MRHSALLAVSSLACLALIAQSTDSDDAMLAKARGLYDTPFTRQLVSFDCSVRFDWKKHFVDTLGVIPPAALPAVGRLQSLSHRVFVDRSRAIVSETPKATDLSATSHASELEATFQAITSSGLNAWLPFAANEILPMKPTRFTFHRIDDGFKVAMQGPNVSATLNLLPDMRVTSVVSDLPQSQHFDTEFISAPGGYLLQTVKIGSGASNQSAWDSSFVYRYEAVQGFTLPSEVIVTQIATGERWDYTLDDCKTIAGKSLEVEPATK
jgi:hypothetical protein